MAIPHGSIRGVSFDYGHVLGVLDLDELARRLRGMERAAAAGREPDVHAIRRAMPSAYRAHDEAIARGLGHQAAWRALMGTLVAAAGSHDDESLRERAVSALWDAQPSRNLWRYVPDEARALLAELAAAEVPMVITSNSEGRIAELLAEVGIAERFVAVLDSGILGFAKPDRRIFERAAAALALPMEAIVHVGDSEAADVRGARAVGMRTIRYDGFVPGAAEHPTEADARACTFGTLRSLIRGAVGA